ncbi:hypothetical protein GY45DRAFT_1341286 [Cubamyces sp. BRFM 1775]|nr:hypothetical protein GY45DRAFT_1341286 [Cubamyces sp. BRFM 1775]
MLLSWPPHSLLLLLPPTCVDSTKAKQSKDGTWQGGVAWESDSLAYNVSNAPRCYTLGPSYQVPKASTAPSPYTCDGRNRSPCNGGWCSSTETACRGPQLPTNRWPEELLLPHHAIKLVPRSPPCNQTCPQIPTHTALWLSPIQQQYITQGAKRGDGPKIQRHRGGHDSYSMAADGLALTSPNALMNYLHKRWLRFDVHTMLHSISYLDPPSGDRQLLDDWDLAPGREDYSELFDCKRGTIADDGAAAFKCKLPFFPELVDSVYWSREMEELPGVIDDLPRGKGKGRAAPDITHRALKKRSRHVRDHNGTINRLTHQSRLVLDNGGRH